MEQITSKSTLEFMANDFWRPKPENIVLRMFEGEKFLKVPMTQWQLKLSAEKKPASNWPIAASAERPVLPPGLLFILKPDPLVP